MSILQSAVLFEHQGTPIYRFALKNSQGTTVELSNLGGIVSSFKVKSSKLGRYIDVVLGFDNFQSYLEPDYLTTGTYLGATVGRYANRIGNSEFEIDGRKVKVSPNHPPHQLHGGFEGFDRKAWDLQYIDPSRNRLTFSYTSADGEEGFPGNLTVRQNFQLTEDNELIIETIATTDQTTAVNLTHHDYFNLNGSGSIGGHLLEINGSAVLEQDAGYVVTGVLKPVEDTMYDFRSARPLDQRWQEGEGYDQSFVLDKGYGEYGKAAEAYSTESGIKLEVFTDEPTVHLYTGKYLRLKNGKEGLDYPAFSGFCLETQHHANAVNVKEFPGTLLKPGEKYQRKTVYRVSSI